MNKKDIINQIKIKKSFLCIGLDTDLERIPKHLLQYEDPIFEFNKQIIDSTKDFVLLSKSILLFMNLMVLVDGIQWKKL